ncbi:ATP-binding protein [Schaalia sp. lx-260]|uniref:ATP-binding protein n=1 Tax=Schaalia sp. lx-260 TaxID=2899082 RepID=UPI001E617C2C|nr:ATP-binding protein [Schaalia sp. lx-260]MCD4548984.1 ATP-binding protein [Schaalia sp. lx-260]
MTNSAADPQPPMHSAYDTHMVDTPPAHSNDSERQHSLRAKVIILTGPSGSGKTSIAARTGIRCLSLDHFYKNDTDPNMPRIRSGLIDWDNITSWHKEQALAALIHICHNGYAQIPTYDIALNQRIGTYEWSLLPEEKVFIAEGIFASHLVQALRNANVLADAVCISRSPIRNMWFRFLRDLREGRKAPHILFFRGIRLAFEEPSKIRHWVARGCRPLSSLTQAEKVLISLRDQ